MRIFKCEKCGNIINLIEGKNTNFTCCGETMKEIVANTTDAAKEKHVPSCHVEDEVVIVSIGETKHPMEEKHYIEYVIAEYSDSVVKYMLKLGDEPEVYFDYEKGMKVYAYCNLHGLWVTEL